MIHEKSRWHLMHTYVRILSKFNTCAMYVHIFADRLHDLEWKKKSRLIWKFIYANIQYFKQSMLEGCQAAMNGQLTKIKNSHSIFFISVHVFFQFDTPHTLSVE